jgi:mRNA interferase MazF
MVNYIPDRRDIVWIEFEPQKGREIQKRRPALIISPKDYNQKTQLALCVPITSKIKDYPFAVLIEEESIKGAILCDQVRSFDWKARKAFFVAKCNPIIFTQVIVKLKFLID